MKIKRVHSFSVFQYLDDLDMARGESVVAAYPEGPDQFLFFTDTGRVIRVNLRDHGDYLYAKCYEATANIEVHDKEAESWPDFNFNRPMPRNFCDD